MEGHFRPKMCFVHPGKSALEQSGGVCLLVLLVGGLYRKLSCVFVCVEPDSAFSLVQLPSWRRVDLQ